MAPRQTKAEKEAAAAEAKAGEHLGDLGTTDGYLGEKVDPKPNEEHSLESGPDGVPALEGQADGIAAANRIGAAQDPGADEDNS